MRVGRAGGHENFLEGFMCSKAKLKAFIVLMRDFFTQKKMCYISKLGVVSKEH